MKGRLAASIIVGIAVLAGSVVVARSVQKGLAESLEGVAREFRFTRSAIPSAPRRMASEGRASRAVIVYVDGTTETLEGALYIAPEADHLVIHMPEGREYRSEASTRRLIPFATVRSVEANYER